MDSGTFSVEFMKIYKDLQIDNGLCKFLKNLVLMSAEPLISHLCREEKYFLILKYGWDKR